MLYMNKEELTYTIMNYLHRTPEACDTLEGIANWWLRFERMEQGVDEIMVALEDMVKKGLIVRQEVQGGEPCYRVLNKGKEALNAGSDK